MVTISDKLVGQDNRKVPHILVNVKGALTVRSHWLEVKVPITDSNFL